VPAVGEMGDTEIVEVTLDDGASLLVRAALIGGPLDDDDQGPSDVGLREIMSFRHVAASVRGITRELHEALEAARPDRVTVELGFDLAVKGSQVLALIADAGTHASVMVRLEWDHGTGVPAIEADEGDEDGGPSGDSSAPAA